MIKARAVLGGKDTIILGLEQVNWDKLIAGQPIMFDGEDIGLDVRVVILGGNTLDDVREDLRSIGLPIPSPVPTDKPVSQ